MRLVSGESTVTGYAKKILSDILVLRQVAHTHAHARHTHAHTQSHARAHTHVTHARAHTHARARTRTHTVSTSRFNSAGKIDQRHLNLFQRGKKNALPEICRFGWMFNPSPIFVSKVRAKFSADFYRTLTEITKLVHVESWNQKTFPTYFRTHIKFVQRGK